MSDMKYLIITADDYGMCQSVNRATDACMSEGIVTSTNVMTNMDFAHEAKKLRSEFPNVSVGVHFTLTAGKSVLPAEKVSSLLESDGTFHSYKRFRELYKQGKIKNEEILAEITAQYEKFLDICGKPDYWNTHQNVHVAFGLFDLFSKKAMEFGIDKMRSHQRIYVKPSGKSTMTLKWRILNPIKTVIINHWQNNQNSHNMKSTQGLIVCLNSDDRLNSKYMFANISWDGKSFGELVVHPADDVDCVYFGQITDKRIKEYKQFTDKNLKNILKENNIELINFDRIV